MRRRRPRADRSSRSPTSGRCSPTASAAGRRGRISAPATSPCARSCRCARCRTGSSACSALDDGAFPRQRSPGRRRPAARRPHVGDRDARSEDRQLLLDALMAATERLIITYTGNDERTNLPRPPAVPVGELLDVVDRTVQRRRRALRVQAIVVRHPLQPFDPRNFTRGGLVAGRPWSFDRVGARGRPGARRGPRSEPRAVSRRAAAAPRGRGRSSSRTSSRFVEHPVRAFLRGRLGIDFARVRRRGRRRDARRARRARAVGGRRAPARGAASPASTVAPAVWPRSRAARCPRASSASEPSPRSGRRSTRSRPRPRPDAEPPESVEVNLELPDGRRLSGTVSGVCGETIRSRLRTRA